MSWFIFLLLRLFAKFRHRKSGNKFSSVDATGSPTLSVRCLVPFYFFACLFGGTGIIFSNVDDIENPSSMFQRSFVIANLAAAAVLILSAVIFTRDVFLPGEGTTSQLIFTWLHTFLAFAFLAIENVTNIIWWYYQKQDRHGPYFDIYSGILPIASLILLSIFVFTQVFIRKALPERLDENDKTASMLLLASFIAEWLSFAFCFLAAAATPFLDYGMASQDN